MSATGGMHPFGDASKSASSAYRPFLHDRHFNAATSFQIGVVRAPPSANQIRGWPKFQALSHIDQTARRHTAQRHPIPDDRSSRTGNAPVPKYANRKSDATIAAMPATSAGDASRSMMCTSDICGPLVVADAKAAIIQTAGD